MKTLEKSSLLQQVKRTSLRTALIIPLAGFLITTSVAIYLNHLNASGLKSRFLDAAGDRVERITTNLRTDIEELNNVKRFFEASDHITQEEFSKFTSSAFRKNHFWIISYAELLTKNESVNIVPKKFRNNSLVPFLEDKESYYLVKNIEPYSMVSHFIDWDLSTDEFIKNSIDSALVDEYLYISPPPKTYFSDTTSNFRLIIDPVYKTKSGVKRLEGVLVAVYPIDSIIIAQSLVEQPKGLSFTLFEGDSKNKLRLVYHLTPKIGSEQVVEDPDLIYTSNFSIAGKNFMVEVKPNDHFIMKNKGANLFWVMVSGYLFSFFVAFVIYRYLTGRRFEKLVEEIEEETRKKNFAIIREFLNSSVDMNGMKLPLGDPISFNKVFAEFFTGEKFDRLPEPHELKIIPELLPHLNAFDDQILPDSEVVLYQFEYRDCVFDVRKFPVNIDNDEYCIGFIIRDITTEINQLKEILKYSDRLEANNRTKNKFFSIIAHDLRSPFQGILGFLEVVLDEFDDIADSDKKEMLSKILVSTRNIYDLLDNLLEWSRTQTDRIPTRLQNIPMKEIVELLSGLYTVSADKKNIDIVNNITEDFSVYADLNMVRTIFRNLVSNAIKFTKPGGKITLDAIYVPDPQNGSEPQILFSVADNGVGIEADMLDKIFRIDEKTVTPGTQNEKGTGLGLILCKEFVERIGGSIWIESTPGKGSTFFFTLPVSKTPEMSS